MRSTLALEVEGDSLVRIGAELAVAGVFRDQRPLRGGAGVADWRMCGWLSDLVAAARIQGELGEHALVLTQGRLRAPRLLLLGLGSRARFGPDAQRAALRDALLRLLDLGASTAALDLPSPQGDDSPEAFAEALLESACAALDERPARLLVRLVAAPGTAPRLRAALEHSAAALPRGGTSIKLVRPPAPASATPPPAAPPRASRPPPSGSGA